MIQARSLPLQMNVQLPDGAALREARLDEVPTLRDLIGLSARELSAADYNPAQIEAALRGAFGVDTQLIRDGTYYVVEEAGQLLACGGWSRRRTLFGSDTRTGRDDALLDPPTEAARIRAFFVHPLHARRGLGTAILQHCEASALAHGFRRLQLMATLPGVRLYRARGYVGSATVEWPLAEDVSITFVPMSKEILNPGD